MVAGQTAASAGPDNVPADVESQLRQVDGTSLDALGIDDLVVFVLAGETPLAGVAGLVDWRLAGKLSAAVASGEHGCRVGERILWPAPPQMHCARLLVWGLGPASELDGERLGAQVQAAYAAAQAAGGQQVAVALPALGPSASKRDRLALQMLFVRATQPLASAPKLLLLRT